MTPRPMPATAMPFEAHAVRAAKPADQAAGLRRLFAAARVCFVPLISNPHVAFGGVMIDRLAAAFTEHGHHTLVVDAAERAPAPAELATIDLADGIEPLAPQLSYLAARGLPLRYVDAQGCAAPFLDALAEAAPQADVAIVHASARDLARMFARQAARPIALACDHPTAVTHAYAAIKLLLQRAGMRVHTLLMSAPPGSPRTERIASHLATCCDLHLGAVLSDWAAIDPATVPEEPPPAALRRLARDTLYGANAIGPAAALRQGGAAAYHAN
jgi:flagellar biosynthesis protein FlhG